MERHKKLTALLNLEKAEALRNENNKNYIKD
jgi:hypothetical protein